MAKNLFVTMRDDPEPVDFIVIGGGIAGASIAWQLAGSMKGVLLEREGSFGYHTTGRSAATSVESLHNQTIFTLTRHSRHFMMAPPEGFTASPLVRAVGGYFTARAAEMAHLEDACEEAAALGVEASLVSSADIARDIPVIREGPEAVYAGLYEPGAQRIDVDCLLQGYLKGARANGCTLLQQVEIESIDATDDTWRVLTGRETFEAPVVINAAGAWADEIAGMAGIQPIGLQPKRRTIVTFDAPAHLDVSGWPMVGDVAGHFYFLPEAGQLMGSAADATPSPACDSQPDEMDVALAVHNIEKYTHLSIDRINHKWAGLRTFASDELPVVGFDPNAPGFFWFAGQGGFGIQTAPALARLGAALASGQEIEVTANALQIDLYNVLPDRLR